MKKFFLLYSNLEKDAKKLLLSTFVTSIGNGVFLLTLGVKLYHLTNSIAAFGQLIIFEYFINFLLDVFVGYFVDNVNPKKIAFLADFIRGVTICLATIVGILTKSEAVFFLIILIINIAKPFYRSSMFTLGAIVSYGKQLKDFNFLKTTLFQVGQIIGIAATGFILQYFNEDLALIIDGVSFIISGLLIYSIKLNININKSLKEVISFKEFTMDWKLFLLNLKNNKKFVLFMLVATIDFLKINIINMLLMPLVVSTFNNNLTYVSVFDGSYAAGCVILAPIAAFILEKSSNKWASVLSLLASALSYYILAFSNNVLLSASMFAVLGLTNLITGTIFMTHVQLEGEGFVKGKIDAIRKFMLTIFSLIILPIISKASEVSVQKAFIISSIICLIYSVALFIVTHKYKSFNKTYKNEERRSI